VWANGTLSPADSLGGTSYSLRMKYTHRHTDLKRTPKPEPRLHITTGSGHDARPASAIAGD